jgi:hypothetical protein
MNKDIEIFRAAERRRRMSRSRLVSDWRNELFTLSRFFIKNGDRSFINSRDGLGYHPSFVLMYEKICVTAKTLLKGITNLQTALEGFLLFSTLLR